MNFYSYFMKPFRSLLFGAIVVGALSAGAKTSAGSSPELCSMLLQNKSVATKKFDTLSLSQVQRIGLLLEGLKPEERAKIYAILAKTDLRGLTHQIQNGTASAIKPLLEAHPDLSVLLIDLVEFGDIFPGIYALPNADAAIGKVINLTRKQELASSLNHPDILKSQSDAPRLRRTIDNSIINLIEQATMEYDGMKFGKTPWQAFVYKLKRFFLPTHNRVQDIVAWSQSMQIQLNRLRLVDSILVREGLSEASSQNLTDAEVQELLKFVLNSPEEISQIEKQFKTVMGRSFANGKAVEIGKFDIYKGIRNLEEMDTEAVADQFDELNVASLDKLAQVLNRARSRRSIGPRTHKDYTPIEVQLRFEAGSRQIRRTGEIYSSWTDTNSNERYSVERQRTRQVRTGTDEKGNAIYTTETYYVSDTVTPSFEDILSGSYDTGDRWVSGLEAVKAAASKMKNREERPRNLMSHVESFVSETKANWYELIHKGNSTSLYEKSQKLLKSVESEIDSQTKYAAWNDSEIKAQYQNDNVKVFKMRNAAMLARLKQSQATLISLGEALRRQLPSLLPFYDLFDYTKWMYTLRKHRNTNYAIKGTIVGTGAAGTYVGLSPEAQYFLAEHGINLSDWIRMILGN